MTTTQFKINTFKQQLIKDFEATSLLAHETISDFTSNDIELAELVTYVRYCIKRIKILSYAVKNSGVLEKNYIEKFNSDAKCLMQELQGLKGNKKTKLDNSAITTCNAMLKTLKAKYSQYINNSENLFDMNSID